MSNELVMAAVASENLPWEGMMERQPDGSIKTLAEVYWPNGRENAARHVMADEAMQEHPDAYWKVAVRPSDMWCPPPPPEGVDARRDPRARREYRQAIRRSLEEFLNEKLAELNFMFSTGAFVLGVARVKVVEFRPVPKKVVQAFRAKFKPVKRKGKPLKVPPTATVQVMPARPAGQRKPR